MYACRHVEYLRKQLEDQCALFSNLNDNPEGASALPQHCHAGIVVNRIYWLLQHAYKVANNSLLHKQYVFHVGDLLVCPKGCVRHLQTLYIG